MSSDNTHKIVVFCIWVSKADNLSNLPERLLLHSSTPLMSVTSLGLLEGNLTSQLDYLQGFLRVPQYQVSLSCC